MPNYSRAQKVLGMGKPYDLNYAPPGEVARRFMLSDAFVRGLRGPVGSGKSVTCAMELLRRAMSQAPDGNGVRRSRWVVVRNTQIELKTTTIKTWLDWLPENVFGKFNWSPPFTHRIVRGDLDMEVIFLALDRDEDVKKLLSLEVTGAWINEAREISKAVVDGVTMRVDRFPSKKDGGATWAGVIMDTNAMEPDHWWPIMSGEAPVPEHMDEEEALMLQKPDNWEFYAQPEGMTEERDERGQVTGYVPNPNAENFKNLSPTYYTNMIRGKTRSWINLYVRNRLGSAMEGKPVYPSFREETHVSQQPLKPIPGHPILVGMDFGLTPAAIFGQRLRGRWLIHRELVSQDMGARRFATIVRSVLAEHFAGFEVQIWGDPAGDQRAQSDETTPFQMFRAEGLVVHPAPTNDPVVRVEAVTLALERLIDGSPAFLLDPRCTVLRAGFVRGYAYRKLQVSGAVRYTDAPDKNRYSHPHDALQYLLCGAGEGRAALHGNRVPKVVVADTNFSPYSSNSSQYQADDKFSPWS